MIALKTNSNTGGWIQVEELTSVEQVGHLQLAGSGNRRVVPPMQSMEALMNVCF